MTQGVVTTLFFFLFSYKEKYRKGMVEWSENIREKDPHYFCNIITEKIETDILLVPDARRITDLE